MEGQAQSLNLTKTTLTRLGKLESTLLSHAHMKLLKALSWHTQTWSDPDPTLQPIQFSIPI